MRERLCEPERGPDECRVSPHPEVAPAGRPRQGGEGERRARGREHAREQRQAVRPRDARVPDHQRNARSHTQRGVQRACGGQRGDGDERHEHDVAKLRRPGPVEDAVEVRLKAEAVVRDMRDRGDQRRTGHRRPKPAMEPRCPPPHLLRRRHKHGALFLGWGRGDSSRWIAHGSQMGEGAPGTRAYSPNAGPRRCGAGQAPFGRNALMCSGSVSSRAPPTRSIA